MSRGFSGFICWGCEGVADIFVMPGPCQDLPKKTPLGTAGKGAGTVETGLGTVGKVAGTVETCLGTVGHQIGQISPE